MSSIAVFVSAAEAAALIPDHATVGVAGMGSAGFPEEVAQEIRARYLDTGHPCDLTVKQGCHLGDGYERGVTRFGVEGLVSQWDAAHVGISLEMNQLVRENKMRCHCLPQGVAVNLWREIAAGRPGLLTKVGLGTFVDPRNGGGKMNDVTDTEIVERVEFKGEEYLFYPSFPLHVALLRGTTADEDGNITFEHDGLINEGLSVAAAAHNSGGIVIVQVERVTLRGTIKPMDVRIPGILVDYVVQATKQEACWQTQGTYYDPSFSGELRKPLDQIPPLPLDETKVIARRCAKSLKRGGVTNLGYGMSAKVASIAAEEGCSDAVIFTAESGPIGGVPAPPPHFGNAYNASALIEHNAMFDIIDGGGVDVTCLGMAQADEEGNINVSKVAGHPVGPGGFVDITQSTKNIIFCGTFMYKAKLQVADGQLRILEQGRSRKFVKHVEHVTFSGRYAKPDQKILYVTERCVFLLRNGRMTLVEIAPGVDLERDILANMDFRPDIAPDLRQMDPGFFREHWGGMKAALGL